MSTNKFQYRQEVYRKLIHLSSLWMPAAAYFFEQCMALEIFAASALGVMAYEVVRRQHHALSRLLEKLMGSALRPDEKGKRFKPSGAIYVVTSAFLCTLFFPRMIAVTALAMALTGDAAAALVGRWAGKRKIFTKSLEGAAAFFVTALATAWVLGAGHKTAAAAALVAALVELFSKQIRIDDNLAVPLAAGSVMLALQHLL